VDTPVDDYAGTIVAIADAIGRAEAMWGPASGIGVGTPGAVDPTTGLLKNSNSTALNGAPLHGDIQAALGREVRVANDADCFALSEATDGAAAGAASVFGVILGTGVGGGIVVNGQLLRGPNAIAGEWGHNPLPRPDAGERAGSECYCGLIGCIETFLSGSGLRREHAAGTGEDLAPPEIAAQASGGVESARRTMATYADRLARALASVINVVDPEVIVLGGGLSNIASLYADVPRLWDSYVFSDKVLTSLVHAEHGDSSGVRGAARLWPE
jgi:predicted NBD/HSP70 family sugar kinase